MGYKFNSWTAIQTYVNAQRSLFKDKRETIVTIQQEILQHIEEVSGYLE